MSVWMDGLLFYHFGNISFCLRSSESRLPVLTDVLTFLELL